jgi:hypothetical protein
MLENGGRKGANIMQCTAHYARKMLENLVASLRTNEKKMAHLKRKAD